MNAPETTDPPSDPSLRKAAVIHEVDRFLIRYGLEPYSRVCAERALLRVDFGGAIAVRGLHIMRAHLIPQLRNLRGALARAAVEIRQALAHMDRGAFEVGLDQLENAAATAAKIAGPEPERLAPGVADFIRYHEARIARSHPAGTP